MAQSEFKFLEVLDLRSVIKSAEAARNIKKIKFCDSVIFPKDRDAETMAAIAAIELAFVDEVLYLGDGEADAYARNTEVIKNTGMTILEDNNFEEGKGVLIKNCGVVMLKNLSPDKKYPSVSLKNVGVLITDASVREAKLFIRKTNVASEIRIDEKLENVKIINAGKQTIDAAYLKSLGKNVFIVVNGGNISIEKDVTAEALADAGVRFLLNGSVIRCYKAVRGYIHANGTLNGSNIGRRLW